MFPRLIIGAAFALLIALPAPAQVVREDGQKSIAGVIGGPAATHGVLDVQESRPRDPVRVARRGDLQTE